MTQHDQYYHGKTTLEFLKEARNYNHFLERELMQFLDTHHEAADFGAGNGEFAARLTAHGKHITAIEADPQLRDIITAQAINVTDHLSNLPMQHRIYSQNVLEHIEDDEATLRELHGKLHAAGKLFLYVPAFACLYTDFDKTVGHFRRYHKTELMQKLERAGFIVERAEYIDSIGYICWWLMGKLPGNKTHIRPCMVIGFDRLIFPLSRIIDHITNQLFGKNLLVIARKF